MTPEETRKKHQETETIWQRALRGMYGDAIPEAEKQQVRDAHECAQAIRFVDLIRKVQKDLRDEIERMWRELENAAAILERKIDRHREGVSSLQESLFEGKLNEPIIEVELEDEENKDDW